MAEIKRGDSVTITGGDDVFRVMAVVDGYAMLRRPRCYPFVEPVTNLRSAHPTEEAKQ